MFEILNAKNSILMLQQDENYNEKAKQFNKETMRKIYRCKFSNFTRPGVSSVPTKSC